MIPVDQPVQLMSMDRADEQYRGRLQPRCVQSIGSKYGMKGYVYKPIYKP
jgi:hypothetical protein